MLYSKQLMVNSVLYLKQHRGRLKRIAIASLHLSRANYNCSAKVNVTGWKPKL